jgi:SAM-dependent methyltransferase
MSVTMRLIWLKTGPWFKDASLSARPATSRRNLSRVRRTATTSPPLHPTLVARPPIHRQDDEVTWDFLRSSYDTVADKYESRFLGELDGKPRDRELLDAFSRSVRDPVVDIGCGPGQVGAFVRARGRRVTGLDLSPQMAKLANRRLDGVLVADMRSLPLASDRIGGLLAFYSLIHLRRPELEPALREFRRVLRPGGHVLFSAHEGDGEVERDEFLEEPVPVGATFFGLDELVGATRGAGLEVTVAERRAPYPSESGTVRLYVEAKRAGLDA